MDTNKKKGSPDEENDELQEQHADRKSRSSAASIDAIISSPTENVRARRSGSSHRLANTGTNISYEGPTAPGGGGSVGTGYSSGNSATGAGSSTDPAESARTHATEKTPTSAPRHESKDERTGDKENKRDLNNDDPDHELIT